MSRRGWVGVDLNGTLARYDEGQPSNHIGVPVPKMLARVRAWLDQTITVKVVTVRANDPVQILKIRQWLDGQGLQEVEITDRKDPDCREMWDDRAVQVVPNTGEMVSPGSSRTPDPLAGQEPPRRAPAPALADAAPDRPTAAHPRTWSMG